MKPPFAACAALLLLAACAPRMTEQQQAFLQELADRPVTCEEGRDCEEKWERAIRWVDEHSAYRIKSVSDHLIQTHFVPGAGKRSHGPEFTIVRYEEGEGRYALRYSSACDKEIECNPSGLQLKASFVTFVMGPPPGVKMHPDGNGAAKVP